MSALRWCGWFAALAFLSVLSHAHLDDSRRERCRFDGLAIDPLHRVDRVESGKVTASFCSLQCALSWPVTGENSSWQVRDELTGRPLDAELASFVQSRVVTVAAHDERTHAFRDGLDAERHRAQFGGVLVPNPLAARSAVPQRP